MKRKQHDEMQRKGHRCLLFALWLVLVMGHQANAQSLQNKVKVVVSADTNAFTWGQHMWLYLTIHNLTNKHVSIPDPSQGYPYVTLELIDEKGNKWNRGIIIHVTGTAQRVVAPKERIEEPYNLVDYATKGEYGHDSPGARLLPGVYKAKASLLNVHSDPFTFKVLPASVDQRSIAREIVEKLHSRVSSAQTLRSGKELLQKYPNSIYLPNIYLELFTKLAFSESPGERSDTLMKYALDFLERFQNQASAQLALSAYVEGLHNRLGVRSGEAPDPLQWRTTEIELQKLKKRFQNERLKYYIETIIKNRKPH